MSLDTALDDARTTLRYTPMPAPPPFGDVLERHRRRRRRSRIVLSVASVVLVIGAVAVIRPTDRDVGVVAGDAPAPAEPAVPTIQNRDVATTVTTVPGFLTEQPGWFPPDSLAPGWVSIALDGVEISVPPTWTVVEDGTCPIAANSLVVGDAGGCALPGTDVPWIQIRWLPQDLAELGDFTTTCQPAGINGAEGCRIDDGVTTERISFNGTEAFIEISYGTPRADLGEITNTIRVVDARGGAPNMEPLDLARSWVEATDAGDCASMFEMASVELRAGRTVDQFASDCRGAYQSQTFTFVSAQMSAGGPTGALATITMATASGEKVEHRLRLAQRFDPAIRGTRWTVVTTDGA